jgi:hypothetical protein
VDVHNKLCVGPRSVCILGGNQFLLKLWLAMVAIAETNAYLTYAKLKKLSSDLYSHPDFKIDLEQELLSRQGRALRRRSFPGQGARLRGWLQGLGSASECRCHRPSLGMH